MKGVTYRTTNDSKLAAYPKAHPNTCEYSELKSCSCLHSLQDAERYEECKHDCVDNSVSSPKNCLLLVQILGGTFQNVSRFGFLQICEICLRWQCYGSFLNLSNTSLGRRVLQDGSFLSGSCSHRQCFLGSYSLITFLEPSCNGMQVTIELVPGKRKRFGCPRNMKDRK